MRWKTKTGRLYSYPCSFEVKNETGLKFSDESLRDIDDGKINITTDGKLRYFLSRHNWKSNGPYVSYWSSDGKVIKLVEMDGKYFCSAYLSNTHDGNFIMTDTDLDLVRYHLIPFAEYDFDSGLIINLRCFFIESYAYRNNPWEELVETTSNNKTQR